MSTHTIDVVVHQCGACFVKEATLGRPLLRCGRCRPVGYCDSHCQREHWPTHKINCKHTARMHESYANRGSAEAGSSSKPEVSPANDPKILNALSNWTYEAKDLLFALAMKFSGILPFEKESGCIAPFVPVVYLDYSDGEFSIKSAGKLKKEEVIQNWPSLKGGFKWAEKETKRMPPSRGIVYTVVVCDNHHLLLPLGVPAHYPDQPASNTA